MSTPPLHELACRAGIEPEYDDAWGRRRTVPDATLRTLLDALGHAEASCGFATAGARADPGQAWHPPAFAGAGRRWGLAVQLYAVRSARNWGIGDFTDLQNLVRGAARLGAAAVGINPLHALFPEHPERASPYSPSSRLFANPLYLDVEAIAELEFCPTMRAQIASRAFQAKIHAARTSDLVDYRKVAQLKLPLLLRLYNAFAGKYLSVDSARGTAFRAYQLEHGEELRRFALFHAIATATGESDWRAWPIELRDPGSSSVAAFEHAHAQAIQLHEYLQWQVSLQLATVNATARDSGMSIGVYTDLAVGAAPSGAEVWSTQPLWAQDFAIGAPPDALNLAGQDWGLPPLQPRALEDTSCRHYRMLLRAAMRQTGALRVDHILGLMRLWWIPQAAPPTAGAYVRYPWRDLLGVICEESRRQRCLVVGEDLGTVPAGLGQAMHDAGILSCRVLYFARRDGAFPAPDAFAPEALIAIGTHDLPPFGMWWRAEDIALRDTLDLWPTQALHRAEVEDRRQARAALIQTLYAQGLIESASLPEEPPLEAVHAYLARTPCNLLMVRLADVLDQRTQANLPGTSDEYPNWRHKLPVTLEAAMADERMARLAGVLRRSGRDDKAAA